MSHVAVIVIVSYGISVSGMSRGFLNIFHTLTEALWPVIALWPVHSLTSVNARKLAVVPANARALGDSLHASVWHETVRPGGVWRCNDI